MDSFPAFLTLHSVKSMKQLFALFLLLMGINCLSAQDSLNFAEKRFRFAEGSLGADFEFIPASGRGAYLDPNSFKTIDFMYPAQFTPRFTITGLHFWRHADFYINVPVTNFLNREVGDSEFYYSTGPETGMKLYPFQIKENKVRPYVGISWNLMNYQQSVGDNEGQSILRSHAPLQFGFTYNKGDKLIELGGSYSYQNELEYYISREATEMIQLPPLSFHLSYRWLFDSSIKDAPEYFDGTIDKQVNQLRKLKKLSSFSFAIGASASLIDGNTYNEENNPFVDNIKMSNSHLDLGIGYYHEGIDAHANLTFRSIPFSNTSFNFRQEYNRRTLGLELYKFLFDYHGFVPYVGVVPSYGKHTFRNIDSGELLLEHIENKWTTGLIFGWDIRQDKRQWYILRTNLRYFPINMNIDGRDYSFNQFEFNLIQFVYYPTRHKWIKKARNGEL